MVGISENVRPPLWTFLPRSSIDQSSKSPYPISKRTSGILSGRIGSSCSRSWCSSRWLSGCGHATFTGSYPYLISLLDDSEPVVRQITCWSLGRYSAWASHLDDPHEKRAILSR
jgi:hypothetical protein